MEQFALSMNELDVGVIFALGLGALIGLAIGFVRSGLFVLSWLGAAMATLFGFPYVKTTARSVVENEFFADLTGGAVIFVVTLVILFLFSSLIGGWVRGSRLNALDRSLGMVCGLGVTALIIAVAYIAVEKTWAPKEQPPWLLEARAIPLIRSGAYMLNNALPKELRLLNETAIDDAKAKTNEILEKKRLLERLVQPEFEKSDLPDREGYNKKERGGIDRLLQGNK